MVGRVVMLVVDSLSAEVVVRARTVVIWIAALVRWVEVAIVVRGLMREVVVLSFRVEVVLAFSMMEEVRAVVWGVLVWFMGEEGGAYEFCDDGGGEEGGGFGCETGG
jgi:hypothetical protein